MTVFRWTGLFRRTKRVISWRSVSSKVLEKTREITIPVPWGHLAGKEWGKPDGRPWIAFHGWLDNCGSFDRLFPYFPDSERLIAIDYPGHGRSSRYPPGMSYHHMDLVVVTRRIAKHLDLAKFSVIGHSLGGIIGMVFAATHPEMVERLVMIDMVKPSVREKDSVVRLTRHAVDECLSLEERFDTLDSRIFPRGEALERLKGGIDLITGVPDGMTEEALNALAERGFVEVSGAGQDAMYGFARDLRHRVKSLYGYPLSVVSAFAKEVRCPHLIIKATRTAPFATNEDEETVLNVYRESNPDQFCLEMVAGHHNVHLTDPEKVWLSIEKFLKRHP